MYVLWNYVHVTYHFIYSAEEIGFLPPSRECHPEEACDLAVEIRHFTASQPFDVDVKLLDLNESAGKFLCRIIICYLFGMFHIVDQSTIHVENDGVYHPQVTAPEVGMYRGTLSVADDRKNLVYWSHQELEIKVITNVEELIKTMIANLTRDWELKYSKLNDSYNELNKKFESFKSESGGSVSLQGE